MRSSYMPLLSQQNPHAAALVWSSPLSCPLATQVCICVQPPQVLSCEMAIQAAALANARAAGLSSDPTRGELHPSAAREGRCQKQTGPALFAPGNSRAACPFPPAAWPTPRVPARSPTTSARHHPSPLFQAELVWANRRGQFPGSRLVIFLKGSCAQRAQSPFAPSLFVFFFSVEAPRKKGRGAHDEDPERGVVGEPRVSDAAVHASRIS